MGSHGLGRRLWISSRDCIKYFPMFGSTRFQTVWICLGVDICQMVNPVTHLDNDFAK
jgi:hypothetical protein